MLKQVATAGATLTLAAGGCGEKFPSQGKIPGSPKEKIELIQADLAHVIDSGAEVPGAQATIEFKDLDPVSIRHLSSFSLRAAGMIHRVDVVSQDMLSKTETKKVRTYMNMQVHMARFAAKFPELNLAAYSTSSNHFTNRVAGRLKYQPYTSVLVMSKKSDFFIKDKDGSEISHGFTTYSDGPVNYDNDDSVRGAYSFLKPDSSQGAGRVTAGVEACQAKLDIDAQPAEFEHAAQEIVCNSLGRTYVLARDDVPYIGYKRHMHKASSQEHSVFRVDKRILPFLIFPKRAYMQIKQGKTPDSLTGLRQR